MNLLKSAFYASSLCILLHWNFALANPKTSLSSWNAGKTKAQITAFVKKVTLSNTPTFVPVSKRVAVFDLDGTLMVEKPLYSELYFALKDINTRKAVALKWKVPKNMADISKEKMSYILAHQDSLMLNLVNGISKADYMSKLATWSVDGRNPASHRLFTDSFYKPMKELIKYLQSNKFSVYIVTGSNVSYARIMAAKALGLSQSHVIGSQFHRTVKQVSGKAEIIYDKGMVNLNDKAQKVLNIDSIIGQRPIVAFGNSDGDYSMLKWTDESQKPHLAGIIHHTDNVREWIYDRNSRVGHLDKALTYGTKHHWLIVDMKHDWKTVY